jgi:hypothetical protein
VSEVRIGGTARLSVPFELGVRMGSGRIGVCDGLPQSGLIAPSGARWLCAGRRSVRHRRVLRQSPPTRRGREFLARGLPVVAADVEVRVKSGRGGNYIDEVAVVFRTATNQHQHATLVENLGDPEGAGPGRLLPNPGTRYAAPLALRYLPDEQQAHRHSRRALLRGRQADRTDCPRHDRRRLNPRDCIPVPARRAEVPHKTRTSPPPASSPRKGVNVGQTWLSVRVDREQPVEYVSCLLVPRVRDPL